MPREASPRGIRSRRSGLARKERRQRAVGSSLWAALSLSLGVLIEYEERVADLDLSSNLIAHTVPLAGMRRTVLETLRPKYK